MLGAIAIGLLIGRIPIAYMRLTRGPRWRRYKRRAEIGVGFERTRLVGR